MSNEFISYQSGLSDIPREFTAITPADADLAKDIRGIYVGTAGNVSLTSINGSTAVFSNVPAGQVIGGLIRRVNATGTTASNIVGLGG